MKNLKLLLTLLLITSTVLAQQNGSITYRMDIDGLDAQTKSMMQNMTWVMTFKDKKSRTDMDLGMMKMSSINTGDKTYSLMEYMGNKFKIPMTNEDIQKTKMNENDYEVDYTNDTKQIAGYTCKRAIIKTKDKDVFNIWYCSDLQLNACDQIQYTKFKGGCPMEFDMTRNGMKMKATATKVDLSTVSDSQFIIPDGYQELKPEQLMQMMGGQVPGK
jgi:hypothetical protein